MNSRRKYNNAVEYPQIHELYNNVGEYCGIHKRNRFEQLRSEAGVYITVPGIVILDDTGDGFVNFKLSFEKR